MQKEIYIPTEDDLIEASIYATILDLKYWIANDPVLLNKAIQLLKEGDPIETT